MDDINKINAIITNTFIPLYVLISMPKVVKSSTLYELIIEYFSLVFSIFT